ncbi:phage scaffolding protein [Clostridium sp.]|uniref:phage scaffolding protein n=1 Tax=Clostridium sp. TaxID=1506 RepID=UPI003216FF0A
MKFEELLKAQGLTDEQIAAITGAMLKEKIYTTNEEKIEERYEKLKIKKEALQEELTEANTTITTLKKDNKGNEDLQKKVTEYEGTIETLKKDSEKKSYDMALELELTKANAKKTKSVKALLDLEKIKQKEDGTFEGLNEQLEGLKKSDDYLFNTGDVKVDYNPAGGGASTGDLATLMRGKDFNLTEYLEKQNNK